MTWVFCFLPFLAAISLGGIANLALEKLTKGVNCMLNWGVLVTVFLLNTLIMGLLLSGYFHAFSSHFDVLHLHFMFCGLCFLIVYRKLVFGKRAHEYCIHLKKNIVS
jgi:hypothetical protein